MNVKYGVQTSITEKQNIKEINIVVYCMQQIHV